MDETNHGPTHRGRTPTATTQADLERLWTHLVRAEGTVGHSLWLMFLQADGTPLPQLTQVEDAVLPPDEELLHGLVELLRGLGDSMRERERIVFLRSRPGGGDPRVDDRVWARSLYAACREAGVATDVVHLATDDGVVPLPMDEVLVPAAEAS